MSKVVVTGIGVISAIGNNVLENHQSLKSGKTGIRKAQFLSSNYQKNYLFGEVNLSNAALLENISFEDKKGLSRTDLLAITAFEEAIQDAQISADDLSNFETGFISGSTVGGMCETEHLFADATAIDRPSEHIDAYTCNAHLLKIAKNYQIKGYTDVINTACSSSANAIMLGAKLIKSGRAKRMIVGGTDALAKFTVNGFNALQIFSPEICQPFDQNRKGLNLGEGAAYLVLEREDLAAGKTIYAEIKGYGNSNDAYHASSLSEEAIGVKACITEALQTAQLKGANIDYVNAHGTATENNDITELRGLAETLGELPPYNSTKSYTGHTLGAAGAIEAVFSILALQNNELYQNLHVDQAIEGYPGPIANQSSKEINHVLSNSFGFAGNCSSLIISKV